MKYFMSFCFGLIFLILSISSHSDNLVIGVEKLEYLPFYSHKNQQYYGYSQELFDQFAIDNKHHIEYKILPVARLLHELIKGKIDFKFPDNPNWKSTEKKEQKIKYSSPIVESTDGVMIKPKFLVKKDDYFYKIGTMRGFTPWALQGKIKQKKMHISEHNSLSGLLQQVLLERINGCYININVAKYYLEHHLNKADALVFKSNIAHDKTFYYLSTIKKTSILQEFNTWLKNNEEFNSQLKKKWGL